MYFFLKLIVFNFWIFFPHIFFFLKVLSRRDLLNPDQCAILEKLQSIVQSYIHPPGSSYPPCQPWEVFVGYNEDFLSSLVLSVWEEKVKAASHKHSISVEMKSGEEEASEEEHVSLDTPVDTDAIVWGCVNRLVWISTPESVVRASTQVSNCLLPPLLDSFLIFFALKT